MFFKSLKQAKKELAKYENKAILMELRYNELYQETLTLKQKNQKQLEANKKLLGDVRAEREVKERYRTAFLRRMNVPVIGASWDGDHASWDGTTATLKGKTSDEQKRIRSAGQKVCTHEQPTATKARQGQPGQKLQNENHQAKGYKVNYEDGKDFEKEFEEAFLACNSREERDALIKGVGKQFHDEGSGIMDAETLEIVLAFCDIAVKTVLTTLAGALAHPESAIQELDAHQMMEIAKDPPPIVRETVFEMIDRMGLEIGNPFADPKMTDAALTAILDEGAK